MDGHWKRNCPTYMGSIKNMKGDRPSEGMSDMLRILRDCYLLLAEI